MASILCNKTSFVGATKQSSKRTVSRCPVVVRASVESVDMSRRSTIGILAGAAALVSGVAPSMAAFGDQANVFGKITNSAGFIPFAGEGFALLLPSKWGPSKEQEYPGTVFRYEDNYFPVNNFSVMAIPGGSLGSPEKFLDTYGYLLGKQAFGGETQSEGGFSANRVSSAALLGAGTTTDKKGKEYITLDVLTKTADGNEGGKHNLIKATVSGGKLWILKVQIGDKRWIRGQDKEAKGIVDSFTVA